MYLLAKWGLAKWRLAKCPGFMYALSLTDAYFKVPNRMYVAYVIKYIM